MHVRPYGFIIGGCRILIGLFALGGSTAATEVSHELLDTKVSEALVTKHVLLSLSQIERWMRILRILRHMGWISGATELARWDELRADKDAWLSAPHHVKAHQSRMRDAYSDRATLVRHAVCTTRV